MVSHLVLPWRWVNCVNPEGCQKALHFQEDHTVVQEYPKEWVENIFGCEIDEGSINFFNEKKVLHRENGPARESKLGSLEWRMHGELHRENGPAVIRAYGDMQWRVNGKLHRVDGPAVIGQNGKEEWWVNGVKQPPLIETNVNS